METDKFLMNNWPVNAQLSSTNNPGMSGFVFFCMPDGAKPTIHHLLTQSLIGFYHQSNFPEKRRNQKDCQLWTASLNGAAVLIVCSFTSLHKYVFSSVQRQSNRAVNGSARSVLQWLPSFGLLQLFLVPMAVRKVVWLHLETCKWSIQPIEPAPPFSTIMANCLSQCYTPLFHCIPWCLLCPDICPHLLMNSVTWPLLCFVLEDSTVHQWRYFSSVLTILLWTVRLQDHWPGKETAHSILNGSRHNFVCFIMIPSPFLSGEYTQSYLFHTSNPLLQV